MNSQTLRTTAPELVTPGKTKIQETEKRTLANGLELYTVNSGSQDVVRLEWIAPTGALTADEYMQVSAAHQLIDSGTADKDAEAIANGFDFYGAYLETEVAADWKSLTLFSLTRLLPSVLNQFTELLTHAAYPDNEIETWKHRLIQQLSIQQEKVSWIARTHFNRLLNGESHLYGFSAKTDDYQKISRAQLVSAHGRGYMHNKSFLVLSGKFDDQTLETIENSIGRLPLDNREQLSASALAPDANNTLQQFYFEKKDAVQSCIRIGRRLFPKSHPDFIPLSIASTILGGYFGSRLMANIREDKGYTYGIVSAVVPFAHGGYFVITTEVGKAVCGDALREIYAELRKLVTEPVPESELHLVRSYLAGTFQRSVDGPFGLADRFKSVKMHGLDYQFIERYQETIHTISPEQITAVAAKWLSPDTMTEVVAG